MPDDTVQEAENFLTRWRKARRLMYKENLVPAHGDSFLGQLAQQGISPNVGRAVECSLRAAERRELNDFLH